jgi:UDP-2,3-diacylglucosamine pyrophosphatase LpxH
MRDFDAVLVSDLHLGAGNSQSDEFLAFLSWVRAPRLIVVGDLFDSARVRGLAPADIAVLRALRAFARDNHVDWLRGNHDPPDDWFEGLLGIEPRMALLLEVGSRAYLVEHGDRWDRSLSWPWWLVTAADAVYRTSQRIDRSHGLARRLKRRSKRFGQVLAALRNGALAESRRCRLDGAILGHSHVAADEWEDGLHYLNCGCWTERPAAFVGVCRGAARTYFWDARAQSVLPLAADRGPRKMPATAAVEFVGA